MLAQKRVCLGATVALIVSLQEISGWALWQAGCPTKWNFGLTEQGSLTFQRKMVGMQARGGDFMDI